MGGGRGEERARAGQQCWVSCRISLVASQGRPPPKLRASTKREYEMASDEGEVDRQFILEGVRS